MDIILLRILYFIHQILELFEAVLNDWDWYLAYIRHSYNLIFFSCCNDNLSGPIFWNILTLDIILENVPYIRSFIMELSVIFWVHFLCFPNLLNVWGLFKILCCRLIFEINMNKRIIYFYFLLISMILLKRNIQKIEKYFCFIKKF